jgi:hypothetical protein
MLGNQPGENIPAAKSEIKNEIEACSLNQLQEITLLANNPN